MPMKHHGKLNHFCLLASSSEDDSSSDEDEEQELPPDLPRQTPLERAQTQRAKALSIIQRCFRAYLRRNLCRKQSKDLALEVAIAARLQMDESRDEGSTAQKDPSGTAGAADKSPTNVIVIEEGDEPPQFAASKAYLFNTQFSQVRFFGRCFLCGCPGHSQRYCALKYCAHCDQYGHSIVCCGRQNFQIQIQPKKHFQKFTRFDSEHQQHNSSTTAPADTASRHR